LEAVMRDQSGAVSLSFKMEALLHSQWLGRHMIIDAAAASMVSNVLLHPERGHERNLRLIAFKQEDRAVTARRFEQEYLGLEPLAEADEYALDPGLRIKEDGLYGPYDFTYNERHGGFLPTAALANALRTTPDELEDRLNSPGIRDRRAAKLIHPWNYIRTDDYLLPARPFDDDPAHTLVGPVHELTELGSLLLEETLRAYEMGVNDGR